MTLEQDWKRYGVTAEQLARVLHRNGLTTGGTLVMQASIAASLMRERAELTGKPGDPATLAYLDELGSKLVTIRDGVASELEEEI